jgi:four helix bundle protein
MGWWSGGVWSAWKWWREETRIVGISECVFGKMRSRRFKPSAFEMKRVTGQAISSADSIHRNIAEGYCQKSIREYIQHLYIALSSLGESVSGYHAYRKADQLSEEDFEILDRQAFKLENGLLRLIESLEHKRDSDTWTETLTINESNAIYSAVSSDHGACMKK